MVETLSIQIKVNYDALEHLRHDVACLLGVCHSYEIIFSPYIKQNLSSLVRGEGYC